MPGGNGDGADSVGADVPESPKADVAALGEGVQTQQASDSGPDTLGSAAVAAAAAAVKAVEAVVSQDTRRMCPSCGRKFNPVSFERHQRVCQRVFRTTRPQFDHTKGSQIMLGHAEPAQCTPSGGSCSSTSLAIADSSSERGRTAVALARAPIVRGRSPLTPGTAHVSASDTTECSFERALRTGSVQSSAQTPGHTARQEQGSHPPSVTRQNSSAGRSDAPPRASTPDKEPLTSDALQAQEERVRIMMDMHLKELRLLQRGALTNTHTPAPAGKADNEAPSPERHATTVIRPKDNFIHAVSSEAGNLDTLVNGRASKSTTDSLLTISDRKQLGENRVPATFQRIGSGSVEASTGDADPSGRSNEVCIGERNPTSPLLSSLPSSPSSDPLSPMEASADGHPAEALQLKLCEECGRRFNPSSFEKHKNVCRSVFGKSSRAPFESQVQRLRALPMSLSPTREPRDLERSPQARATSPPLGARGESSPTNSEFGGAGGQGGTHVVRRTSGTRLPRSNSTAAAAVATAAQTGCQGFPGGSGSGGFIGVQAPASPLAHQASPQQAPHWQQQQQQHQQVQHASLCGQQEGKCQDTQPATPASEASGCCGAALLGAVASPSMRTNGTHSLTLPIGRKVSPPHQQLKQCPHCGRSFRQAAIETHVKVCQSVFPTHDTRSRPRHVYDSRRHRLKGTPFEAYSPSSASPPPTFDRMSCPTPPQPPGAVPEATSFGRLSPSSRALNKVQPKSPSTAQLAQPSQGLPSNSGHEAKEEERSAAQERSLVTRARAKSLEFQDAEHTPRKDGRVGLAGVSNKVDVALQAASLRGRVPEPNISKGAPPQREDGSSSRSPRVRGEATSWESRRGLLERARLDMKLGQIVRSESAPRGQLLTYTVGYDFQRPTGSSLVLSSVKTLSAHPVVVDTLSQSHPTLPSPPRETRELLVDKEESKVSLSPEVCVPNRTPAASPIADVPAVEPERCDSQRRGPVVEAAAAIPEHLQRSGVTAATKPHSSSLSRLASPLERLNKAAVQSLVRDKGGAGTGAVPSDDPEGRKQGRRTTPLRNPNALGSVVVLGRPADSSHLALGGAALASAQQERRMSAVETLREERSRDSTGVNVRLPPPTSPKTEGPFSTAVAHAAIHGSSLQIGSSASVQSQAQVGGSASLPTHGQVGGSASLPNHAQVGSSLNVPGGSASFPVSRSRCLGSSASLSARPVGPVAAAAAATVAAAVARRPLVAAQAAAVSDQRSARPSLTSVAADSGPKGARSTSPGLSSYYVSSGQAHAAQAHRVVPEMVRRMPQHSAGKASYAHGVAQHIQRGS